MWRHLFSFLCTPPGQTECQSRRLRYPVHYTMTCAEEHRVVRKNIPQSLTDEIHTNHVSRPQSTSLLRQKMTEVCIGWRRRKGSAQQQIDQEKNAAVLISSATPATCPFAVHRAVGALLHYSGPDHRALGRLNVQIKPTQEIANLSVLHQRLPQSFRR
jgi:hypothetical protein